MVMTTPVRWPTILPAEVPAVSTGRPRIEPLIAARDPSRVRVEVMTTSNRPGVLEFRVRRDTVEAWFCERLAAVFDRERLRAWLTVNRPGVSGDLLL